MCLSRRTLLLVAVLCLAPGRGLLAADADKTETPLKPLNAKQLQTAWKDLASDDAASAYVAICLLSERPTQAVILFKKHLRPIPAPDAKKVARLIGILDSGRFSERDKATKELRRLGVLAAPALRESLKKKPTLEMRKRIEELLQALEGPIRNPDILRAVRAVEVLERIGTKEAREFLRMLSQGAAGARLTQECQDSLQRLKRRP